MRRWFKQFKIRQLKKQVSTARANMRKYAGINQPKFVYWVNESGRLTKEIEKYGSK